MSSVKIQNIPPGGWVYSPVATDRSYMVQNLSRFSAIDLFLDGRPASFAERRYGSGRISLRIPPTGFRQMPVTGNIGISPAGFMVGDPISDTSQLNDSLKIGLSTFNYETPVMTHEPGRVLIGAWNNVDVSPTGGEIPITSFIRDWKVPQTDDILHFRIKNNSISGVDGNSYLRLYTDGESERSIDIGIGVGQQAGSFYQDFYIREKYVTGMTIKTSETGTRRYSGMIDVLKSIREKERRSLFEYTIVNENKVIYIANYHLSQIILSYYHYFSGSGIAASIKAEYLDKYGGVVGEDTYSIPFNSGGVLGITPGADITRLTMTNPQATLFETQVVGKFEYEA